MISLNLQLFPPRNGMNSPWFPPLLKATVSAVSREHRWFFSPSMPVEGQFPLGQIAIGAWKRVPLIVGISSCEGCKLATYRSGPVGAFGMISDHSLEKMDKNSSKLEYNSMYKGKLTKKDAKSGCI